MEQTQLKEALKNLNESIPSSGFNDDLKSKIQNLKLW